VTLDYPWSRGRCIRGKQDTNARIWYTAWAI
jgi:hypothetical protein